MSVSLLTYGLTEGENIPSFLNWAKTFLSKITDNYEIIYIDDGSTDDTIIKLNSYKKKNKINIKIYKNKINKGSAYSLKKGIKLCKKKFLIIQMVDRCYVLDNFLKKKEKLLNGEVDCIHGYREKKILSRSDNLYKGFVSLCNWFLISILFGFKIKDYQNTYFIRTSVIKNIRLYAYSSFVNAELILKIYKNNFNVLEVGVPFKKRNHGVSKGTKLNKIIQSIKEILFYFIFKRKYDL